MKKTININLGGRVFNIEEDAYQELNEYLEKVRSQLDDTTDHDEVMADIESSIAEKFSEKINPGKQAVIDLDVAELIKVMGAVEEFGEGERKSIIKEKNDNSYRRLYRNPDDVIIAGVCSGIAAYFNIDPVFIRLLFVALVLAGGSGIAIYLVLWLVMPKAKTASQKLEMHGDSITISAIQNTAKKGYEQIKKNSVLRKIINFPIILLRSLVNFLRRICGWILPILRILLAIFMIIGSIIGFVCVTVGIIFVLSNGHSPYLINNFPVQELISLVPFYWVMITLYLSLVIPAIVIIILGLSLIRKKNMLSFVIGASLIGIWLISGIAFLSIIFSHAPQLAEKIDSYSALQETEVVFPEKNFENINVSGKHLIVNVQSGKEFKVTAQGFVKDLESLVHTQDNNTFILQTEEREDNHYCIACHANVVRVNITTPKISNINGDDNVLVIFNNYSQVEDITLNGKENVGFEFNGENNFGDVNIVLGDTSSVDLVGRAKNVIAQLKGNSWLDLFNLHTEKINLKLNDQSRAKTKAENVEAVLHNESRWYYLGDVKNSKVETFEDAKAIQFEEVDRPDSGLEIISNPDNKVEIKISDSENSLQSLDSVDSLEENESGLFEINGKSYRLINVDPDSNEFYVEQNNLSSI